MDRDVRELGLAWRLVVAAMVKLLVKEARNYRQLWPNDVDSLRELLQPGDVILVEGNQRVSQIIKYLTQSSWSHAALYVGDAMVRKFPERAEELRSQYGAEAENLLIEANIESGVTTAAISKYRQHNIRICRPVKLRPDDVEQVIDGVLSQIGTAYNVRHIVGLMRYYFPFSFLPRRFQITAMERAGDDAETLICSSQIAMAFQKVRYPVQPVVVGEGPARIPALETPRGVLARWRRRSEPVRARPSIFETRIFKACDPFLLTPRDFDLSPYFEIVKHSVAGAEDFDYKRMRWSDDGRILGEEEPSQAATAPAAAAPDGPVTAATPTPARARSSRA